MSASSYLGRFILPENIEEEAVFTRILLYKKSTIKEIIYCILCVVTLGIVPLFVKWYPSLITIFLYTQSKDQEADLISVKGKDESMEYIETIKRKIFYDNLLQDCQTFEYRFYTYFLDKKENLYRPIQFLIKEKTCAQIIDELGLGIQGREELENKMLTYGPNTTDVPIKTDFNIIMDEILSPFYLFQVFSCILWAFFEAYYIYASVIFTFSVGAVLISFSTIKKNYQRLYKQAHLDNPITVHRNIGNAERVLGSATTISSTNLVPGDIIEIPENETMPCDALLLDGMVIMNESMMTGESVPVIKSAILKNDKIFDYQKDTKNIIFSGTKCLETRKTKGSNNPVIALVVNTGFATEKGRLVRTLVFPSPELFKFYQDSVKFVLFMGLFALILFSFTILKMLAFGDTTGDIIIGSLDIITIAVPPALATCISVGAEIATERLESKKILTKSQNKIIVAGRVDMMCFDKTGTLTEETLDLYGVRCVSSIENTFGGIVNKNFFRKLNSYENDCKSKTSSHKMLETMATCHLLSNVKNSVHGDPLDMKMFESLGWTLNDKQEQMECLIKPPTNAIQGYHNPSSGLQVLKRFDFDPVLQRMSVIIQDPSEETSRLYVKGSPEVIRELCTCRVPPNFDDILCQYTQSGLRVLACATKTLDKKVKYGEELHREDFEKSLEFVGFLIFQNKLKEATPIGIAKLRYAKIPSIMITGDNPLTAICVARDCGIIQVGQRIVLAELTKTKTMDSEVKEVNYRFVKLIGNFENVAEQNSILDSKNFQQVELQEFPARTDKFKLIDKHQETYEDDNSGNLDNMTPMDAIQYGDIAVAITGEALQNLRETLPEDPFFKALLQKAKVYARMKPEEKAQVIEELQKKGFIVGMCGDGANDCPALKQANIGISLSEAEASIAAPFLSKVCDISSVDTILREGRAGLVTSFQCFKYMALYSVIQSLTIVTLYADTSSIPDQACLYIDLVLILPLAFTMSLTEANETLSPQQPASRLISTPVLSSIIGQVIIQGFFLISSSMIVKTQSWYVSPNDLTPDSHFFANYSNTYESTTLFLVSNFQYIACVIAFSIGKPFRKDFFSNKVFTITVITVLITSAFLIFNVNTSISDFFGLLQYPSYSFRYFIFGYCMANCVLTLFYDRIIVPRMTRSWSKNPNRAI